MTKHDQAYCGNSARTLALSPSPSSHIEGIFLSARKVAIPTALPASISVGKCTPIEGHEDGVERRFLRIRCWLRINSTAKAETGRVMGLDDRADRREHRFDF